jgi:hypothetical protein
MMNVNDSQVGLQYMGRSNYYEDSVVVMMKGYFMELTKILTTFTTIDLSNNMFEGKFHKSLENYILSKVLTFQTMES